MARPAITLTPGDLSKLEAEIHRFDSNDDLAKYLDVGRATIARWLKAGGERPPGDPDFRRQFRDIVLHAREGSKRTLLGVVTDIALNGENEAARLNASKYLLDRVHKLSANLTVQNPDGSAIGAARSGDTTLDLSKLTTEQLVDYHAILAAATVRGDDDTDTNDGERA